MNVSRKEFMNRGLFAFGQDIVKMLNPSPEQIEKASPDDYNYLQLDNSRCLAQKGGCFACIDHCPKEAITIALGVGVVIDSELCDGCGECAEVCPIHPNVIQMKNSENESTKTMERRSE